MVKPPTRKRALSPFQGDTNKKRRPSGLLFAFQDQIPGFFHIDSQSFHHLCEFFFFFFTQRQLHDLFHAVLADDRGDPYEQVLLAVFPVQFHGAREDALFVMQDGAHQGGRSTGDAVFGAPLAGHGDPAAFHGLFVDHVPLELHAPGLFELFHGHAAEVQQGPGDELVIPMLADHIGAEAAGVQARHVA